MGTEVLEIYRCNVCWNTVEVLHAGVGTLVCCGKPMDMLVENTDDAVQEMHVPVIEQTDDAVRITVGTTPHPMEEDHYIQWIQAVCRGMICRRLLTPGDAPQVIFPLQREDTTIRACCSLHGLSAVG